MLFIAFPGLALDIAGGADLKGNAFPDGSLTELLVLKYMVSMAYALCSEVQGVPYGLRILTVSCVAGKGNSQLPGPVKYIGKIAKRYYALCSRKVYGSHALSNIIRSDLNGLKVFLHVYFFRTNAHGAEYDAYAYLGMLRKALSSALKHRLHCVSLGKTFFEMELRRKSYLRIGKALICQQAYKLSCHSGDALFVLHECKGHIETFKILIDTPAVCAYHYELPEALKVLSRQLHSLLMGQLPGSLRQHGAVQMKMQVYLGKGIL